MLRTVSMVIAGALLGAAAAQAQPAAGGDGKGYAEVVLQSAFGNVTSQSFGGEIGFTVARHLQVFVEGGRTRDVATSTLSGAAQTIAGALSQVASSTSYSVKEPVDFGVAGVRYLVRIQGSRLQPYVLGGIGIAKVSQDVRFSAGGTDVTATMQQFGIVLGTDLSGSYTRPMFVVGGGVAYPVWQRLSLDVQFRFGRVFAESSDVGVPRDAITVGRAGLGLGVRF